ncbi:DUF2304 domain-containing protein [Marmoricola sp. RAF53]|uniref:DUF2304 domain-containing protein n=1 Tax=Marmoricola sp. RAF53 TaxID=3233059 RepID=UPI003F98F537
MIKILLILGMVGLVVFALRGSTSSANLAVRRLAGITFAVVATISILFPDLVTWMANLVNVGRGTDLVLYALVVAFLYVTIGLYQRIHRLEEHLTDLTRELALRSGPRAAPAKDDVPAT